MIRLLPGVYALLVCLFSFAYGKWRRGRGSLVKAREMVRVMLVVFALGFPALALYSIMITTGMTWSDRVAAFLASLLIGGLPLAVGLCFWGALRPVRLSINNARSSDRNGPR